MNFLSLIEKEKEKVWIVTGWNQTDTAHTLAKRARAVRFTQGIWWFEKPVKSHVHYSYVSLTLCAEAPHFLFLREVKPPTVDGGAVAPASLPWTENATVMLLLCLTPNSNPRDEIPQLIA
jgi:hypothetical protein